MPLTKALTTLKKATNFVLNFTLRASTIRNKSDPCRQNAEPPLSGWGQPAANQNDTRQDRNRHEG
jgi:hypothetical protein